MTLALVCMSHSPLLEVTDPPKEIQKDVDAAFAVARKFVEDFDPDLVVSFAPDHYNGFFYELMPPFCVGYEAVSVGDYGSEEGPLNVPTQIAKDLAQAIIDADLDAAISLKMEIDHGAVQPLELLFGSIAAKPVVPIFVNSVAPPFVSMRRVRQLGTAVGNYLKALDQKVLIIGSGGLSHDPPVPQIATATPEQKAMLLNGRHPTAAARHARQQRVIDTAAAFAKGEANIMELNPDWDREFLAIIASGDLEKLDTWTAPAMAAAAGNSAHEVRNWVAAYNALATAGDYTVVSEYYRPIPEFIAGFGVTTATVK